MINTKKYFFFLISFLLVVLYLHPASALAANKIRFLINASMKIPGKFLK